MESPDRRGYGSRKPPNHGAYHSPPVDYRSRGPSIGSRGYGLPLDSMNYGPPADRYHSSHRPFMKYGSRHEPPAVHNNNYHRRHFLHRDSDVNLDDSLDPEISHESVYQLWGRFADKTSMQGCAYIYTSRLWYVRLLWIILLLCAIGGMVFHLFYLTSQYTLFPKITKITLNFSNLPFPAVTFCNGNVIRRSQLNKTSMDMQDLINITRLDKFDPKNHRYAGGFKSPPADMGGDLGGDMFPASPGGIGGDKLGLNMLPNKKRRRKRFIDGFKDLDFDKFLGNHLDNYDYFYDMDDFFGPPPKDTQSEIQDGFKNIYLGMDRDLRIGIGHQIEDMLISCSFDGYKCYAENFTVVSNEDFGNCYTLHSSFMSRKAGPRNGLSIILYMELEEYIEGISQGYGIRVVVHERNSFPFPADRGIYLSPSFESHIGLKMTKISREDEPYGKCNDGVAFSQQYGIRYTRIVCQALCRQNEIFRRCGCYDDVDEELFYFIHEVSDKFCMTTEDFKCMDKVNYEYDKKLITCTCVDPCYEQDYTLYPSYRIWPTDDYAVLLQQGVCDRLPWKCERIVKLTDPRALSQNFLKFVIYYEDLNFEVLDEEPEIEDAQFVSDVGGAIGLWIGLSLLAIFEVIQFFCELAIFGCKVCCSADNKKGQQKEQGLERKRHETSGSVYSQSQIPLWSTESNRNGAFEKVDFSRASPESKIGWVYDY